MIHLVSMPFGTIQIPSLALATFKAQLNEADMPCEVHNFYLSFAAKLKYFNYELAARMRGREVPLTEWLFSRLAWGYDPGVDEETFLSHANSEQSIFVDVEDSKAWLLKLRQEIVPAFIEECLDQLFTNGSPKVVAFTCLSYQTLASIALARRIVERDPKVKIAFGGSCFHGEMGREYMKQLDFIDAISIGEADDIIVDFFKALHEGHHPENLQGILYRKNGVVYEAAPHKPVNKDVLNALPTPDFSDYMSLFKRLGLTNNDYLRHRIFLPIQFSRGCWWGQKSHCVFCGLNNEGMNYRTMSPDRILTHLETYADAYPTFSRYFITDNILPPIMFSNIFPKLADNPKFEQHYMSGELKASTKPSQIEVMSKGRLKTSIPGIENLSTHLLGLLAKGTRCVENLRYLKFSRIHGHFASWFFLYGIPGERKEDYDFLAELIPKIVHLGPPAGGPRPVEVHRFSPYFNNSEQYAHSIEPASFYKELFPKEFDLRKIAYNFTPDWKDVCSDEERLPFVQEAWKWIDIWRDQRSLPKLEFRMAENGMMLINDTRYGVDRTYKLSPLEAKFYQAIYSNITMDKLAASGQFTDRELEQGQNILSDFVKYHLAFEENQEFMGLALPPTALKWPLKIRKNYYNYIGQDMRRSSDIKENEGALPTLQSSWSNGR